MTNEDLLALGLHRLIKACTGSIGEVKQPTEKQYNLAVQTLEKYWSSLTPAEQIKKILR